MTSEFSGKRVLVTGGAKGKKAIKITEFGIAQIPPRYFY